MVDFFKYGRLGVFGMEEFSFLEDLKIPPSGCSQIIVGTGWNLQFHPHILTNLQLAMVIQSPIIHFNQALKS
jgi:hypothetical protein